jgi:hypothetical protein
MGFLPNHTNAAQSLPASEQPIQVWNHGHEPHTALKIFEAIYETPEKGQRFPVKRRHVGAMLRRFGRGGKLALTQQKAQPAAPYEPPPGYKLVKVEGGDGPVVDEGADEPVPEPVEDKDLETAAELEELLSGIEDEE